MADNDTISELFARDPFSLSKTDIDRIIEFYRQRRTEFTQTGKASPRVDKPKADLNDLGLV